MKPSFIGTAAIVLASGLALSAPSVAKAADSEIFDMVVSAGAKTCLPDARGRVTINSLNSIESMHVEVSGLPADAEFDVFVIQVPTAPFGLAWYQGDIDTDSQGDGVSDFAGRFSIETFIVAPGSAPAPVVFNKPPFADASANLGKEGPVQLYHLGIWFDSPAEAAKAGCANTETPFNGTHNAGIQVLNTSNFSNAAGPLRYFNP